MKLLVIGGSDELSETISLILMVTGKLFQKRSSVGRWQPEEVIEKAGA